MWLFLAIASSLFAALTTILAKIGIDGVSSNLATAIRTTVVLALSWGMVFLTNAQTGLMEISISPVCALVRKTMPQDSARTTVVRIAVARLELTPSIPIFARMVVSAANREEAIARNSHILDPSFAMWLYCIIIVPVLP